MERVCLRAGINRSRWQGSDRTAFNHQCDRIQRRGLGEDRRRDVCVPLTRCNFTFLMRGHLLRGVTFGAVKK